MTKKHYLLIIAVLMVLVFIIIGAYFLTRSESESPNAVISDDLIQKVEFLMSKDNSLKLAIEKRYDHSGLKGILETLQINYLAKTSVISDRQEEVKKQISLASDNLENKHYEEYIDTLYGLSSNLESWVNRYRDNNQEDISSINKVLRDKLTIDFTYEIINHRIVEGWAECVITTSSNNDDGITVLKKNNGKWEIVATPTTDFSQSFFNQEGFPKKLKGDFYNVSTEPLI